uniref:Uncharacterized protein n=1 Tax=Molossus molossus TaxID=27622 RepID=A0A7J8IYZ6_MOLMO|nr:hypothetical protein HJG59_010255 [Molossus molossus]
MVPGAAFIPRLSSATTGPGSSSQSCVPGGDGHHPSSSGVRYFSNIQRLPPQGTVCAPSTSIFHTGPLPLPRAFTVPSPQHWADEHHLTQGGCMATPPYPSRPGYWVAKDPKPQPGRYGSGVECPPMHRGHPLNSCRAHAP